MTDLERLRDESLKEWHLIRADECGVPGRQPNIRATSNQVFGPEEMQGDEITRSAARSFIGLSASYWNLPGNSPLRVRVTYGTPAREPRVQVLYAEGEVVHGPLPLPVGRTESFVFDLPVTARPDGRLVLRFEAQARSDLSGQMDKVADPAVVSRIELYARQRPEASLVLDAATVPDGGVVIAARVLPDLMPVPGVPLTITYPDGSVVNAETDVAGDACVVRHSLADIAMHGDLIRVEAACEHGLVRIDLPVDDAFRSGWPPLSPVVRDGDGIPQCHVLDGDWEFAVVGSSEEIPRVSNWQAISVPGQWFQQGFEVTPGFFGAYRLRFRMPPASSERYILRFDAVYAHADVYLNGALLGGHEGGFTPFQFEITQQLQADNEMFLVVQADSISDKVSAASAYAAHSLGGITRSVRMLGLPADHIARLQVDAGFDGECGTARIVGRVGFGISDHIDGTADRTPAAELHVEIRRPGGLVLAHGSALVAPGNPRFTLDLRVPDVFPWTAETPVLYDVHAWLGDGSGRVVQPIGFRSVSVSGHQLQVNGRPIQLRGVERHEQDPLRGRSTLPDLWRVDVELMKDANINNVFTCHYPHAEGFLDLCDVRGLWVIDESPTVWADADSADDPDRFVALVTPTLEMIERDFSRPSVVVWMLGDECLWGRNFWRLVLWLRSQGLTAPLMFSFDIGGASSLDIASRHYPPADFSVVLHGVEKPVTFDQYWHVNCYNRREVITDPELRDWWGSRFAAVWDSMRADERVLGGQLWAWSDDEFHINDSLMVGYGAWGIVDSWRRPKPEWWNVKQVYAPVRITDSAPVIADGLLSVELENRYDFVDLSDHRLRFTTPYETGETACAGAPRSAGSVVVRLQHQLAAGDEVRLEILDPEGTVVTARVLTVPSQERPCDAATRLSGHAEQRVNAERRAHVFTPNLPEYDARRVDVGEVQWLLDEESGLLRVGRLHRRTIVLEGPALMMLEGIATQRVGPHHRHAIEPFTDTCAHRRVQSVAYGDDPRPRLAVEVSYDEADFAYTATVNPDGSIEIAYSVTAKVAMEPRQIGVVLDLAEGLQTLRWSRTTAWGCYPGDHIGRPRGTARAFPEATRPRNRDGVPERPDVPWSQDVTALGSADFRSTRRDVHWASLTDHTGAGLWVTSRERADVRAWIQGDRVRLLVAQYSSGGSDPFLARSEPPGYPRLQLRPGDVLTGSAALHLGRLAPTDKGTPDE